jgi:hypothetical protein
MTKIESNKLIAEFMGYDLSKVLDEMPLNKQGNFCNGNGDLDKDGKPCYATYAPSLQYNTSWDWLMPVVDKIEKTAYVNIKGCAVDISTIVSTNAPSKIDAVYKAVVEFIKWHNQNKN